MTHHLALGLILFAASPLLFVIAYAIGCFSKWAYRKSRKLLLIAKFEFRHFPVGRMHYFVAVTFLLCLIGLAHARPGPDSNYNSSVAGGGGSNTLTFTQTSAPTFTAGNGTTSQTFSGLSTGTASADRKVDVCFFVPSNGPITAVTIGGVSATQESASAASGYEVELWDAAVPTGTTANVVVTFTSGSTNNIGVAVGSLTGTTSTPTFQASSILALAYEANPAASSPALSLTTGGYIVSCLFSAATNTLSSTTLTVGTQGSPSGGNPSAGTFAFGTTNTTGSTTPSFSAGGGYTGTAIAAASFQ